MISKQKKIVYGAVLASSLAVLATQLWARNQAVERVPPLEVPADGGSPAQPANLRLASATSDASASAGGVSAARGGGELDDVLARLEYSLGSLRNFQSTEVRAEGASGDEPSSSAAPPAGAPAQPTLLPLPPDPAELDALLAASPLRGLLHAERDSAALFGGRIVRVGDQLLPGEATVRAIESRFVLIDFRGLERRVELPPFEPRPRAVIAGGSGPRETETEPAQPAPASNPTATAATPDGTESSHAANPSSQPL